MEVLKTWHEDKLMPRVLRQLYDGPFSDVFAVELDETPGEVYAMKCERIVGCLMPVLELDARVLRELRGVVGFPRVIATGTTELYRYIIMELVGADLGGLRRASPDKKFSMGTALGVAYQTLARLEALHHAGFLCRDVKAPNFAIGIGERAGIVYMLDFGFARRYRYLEEETMRRSRYPNGNRIARRSRAALCGTFFYAPLNAHAQKDQGPGDDLESWFYMAVEALTGSLPWTQLNPHMDYQVIAEWKKHIRGAGRATFLDNLPAEFDDILSAIERLNYYDEPNYAYLAGRLEAVAGRLGVSMEPPYDWQTDNGLRVRRSKFVGEPGESDLASARMRAAEEERREDEAAAAAVEVVA